ncbi:MAG: aminodeoxychorismate synthase component I, partial [Candidatus Margulisiibacteriota bacterium]
NYEKYLLPLSYFGFYHKTIVIDHKRQEKYFVFIDFDGKIKHDSDWQLFNSQILNLAAGQAEFKVTTQPQSNFTKEAYLKAIEKAKRYIFEGDIYQVNLSHQIRCKYQGSSFEAYQKLRAISPAPFSVFLSVEYAGQKAAILSSSPERFIKKKGSQIITQPIKGTIHRGINDKDDKKQGRSLFRSLKNRAELLMIIDLERNDLGRIAKAASVKVKKLMEVQKFKYLFHLVSTITAKLPKKITFGQIFAAMFPGGSITGAPKIRAMEIIKELETVERNVYTGALGYFGFNQDFDFNIAIRTIYLAGDFLYFHVGGGIVADSDPESEWEETKVKAAGILAALEQDFPHE